MEVGAYGALEAALALALPMSVVLGLGASNAVPQFLLKRRQPGYISTFGWMVVLLGGASLAWAAGSRLLGGAAGIAFTGAASGVLVVQGILCARLKAADAPGRSSLLEGGMYFSWAVFLGIVAVRGSRCSLDGLLLATSAWLLILIVSGALSLGLRSEGEGHRARAFEIVRFGLPLVASALMVGLMTAAGRLTTAALLSLEDVASLAFFHRLSAGVLLLHQFLNLIWFTDLYTRGEEFLDRYFSWTSAALAAAAVGAWALLSWLLPGRSPRLDHFFQGNSDAYWAMTVNAMFWSALAHGQLILEREGKGAWVAALAACGVLTFAGLCAVLKVTSQLTLARVCLAQAACTAGVALGQAVLLRSVGIRLRRAPWIWAAYLLPLLLPSILRAS